MKLLLFATLLLAAALVAGALPLPRALLQAASDNATQQNTTGAVTSESGPFVNAFPLSFGGYENYFLTDNTTSGVVLVTQPGVRLADGNGSRFLVAFPAANSGAVAYFNSSQGDSRDLDVELVNGTLTSTTFNGSVGLTGTLTFNRNATLYRAIVGSVRTIRDYVEGPRLIHPIFNHSVYMNGSSVVLYRQYINGTGANTLVFTPADNSTTLALTPDGNFTVDIAPGASQGRVNFTATVHWPQLDPLFPPAVLVAPANRSELAPLPQLNQLAFLTYTEKFLAGSWRFLTYFGRDSLIALRLMEANLSSTAIEAALGAALGHVNTMPDYYQYDGADFIPVGTVCHEETLGDYASFVNIQFNQSQLGDQLWCDYKMVDADFMLAPAVAVYLLDLNQSHGRVSAFLNTSVPTATGNHTYRELLEDNAAMVVNLSRPFAANQTVANLIHLRPNQPVGNWRDSDTGLGNGRIPMDVQFLVPGALRAIARLSRAGLVNSSLATEAGSLASAWEKGAPPLFRISVPLTQANQLLSNYSGQLGLPDPGQLSSPDGNLTFYALALNDDGSKVPIMNSDLSLAMVYSGGALPPEVLATVPQLLEPFPGGLVIPNVGMAVANPAYAGISPDNAAQLYQNFTNGAYHGTVVWGWQQAMMIVGIERQLAMCNSTGPTPAFCSDSNLVSALRAGLERLWGVVEAAKDVAFSELWSWKADSSGNFRVASLAETTTQSTEADAIQLWSFAFLTVENPWGNGTLLTATS